MVNIDQTSPGDNGSLRQAVPLGADLRFAPFTRMEISMAHDISEDQLARNNIAQFQRQIEAETDDSVRKILATLLAKEQQKLASTDGTTLI